MNDLAQLLLKGGDGTKQTPKGTFYRQFLPASNVTISILNLFDGFKMGCFCRCLMTWSFVLIVFWNFLL